jgi:hypothetical protein
MFGKLTPPILNMGGLYQFEKAKHISAPGFIEELINAGSETPDAPLAPDVVDQLIALIAHCLGDGSGSRKRAARVLKKAPDLVAFALREFLEDPLSSSSTGSAAETAPSAELPSVLDMRAAWLASGGEPATFDGLKLWEHSRILRQQEKRQRATLADAAIAARVAKSKDEHFKRFVSEMLGDGRAKTPRDWVQHLFNATAHLPKVTQEELSLMKGRA